MRRRFFLLLSIAVVGALWASILAQQALGVTFLMLKGVRELAVYVVKLTLVEGMLIWTLMRGSGERPATVLGFGLQDFQRAVRSPRALRAIGVLFMLTIAFGSVKATLARAAGGSGSTILDAWVQEPNTSAIVAGWVREPGGLPWLILTAIVGGGFCEELERAFCLTRFERAFGTVGLVLAVIVDCVQFGVRHLYQGHWNAISAAAFGLTLALVFLRERRVADAMLAHAGFDLVCVFLIWASPAGS